MLMCGYIVHDTQQVRVRVRVWVRVRVR